MTMMNPIFMSVNASNIFASWTTSALNVLRPAAVNISAVGIAVLALCLLFMIFKAVAAHNQNPSEFRNCIMYILGILVGMMIFSTFGAWGLGFFGG
ncbi:hypothetical protein [Pygmaiobacter massiliensis]|uniref:hypothetical protein n=1 Tax=Pygmaiobacter massiliensis TaxID=1917873 RepID=UPI000C7A2EB6|nr:hypothetical protein [Pygmaiobacter massiliensis]MDY4785549.1 hypothetical protein [Pygmaiobacter massiliensis]